MSLSELVATVESTSPSVLSSDLFDTLLLRDHTTELGRLTVGSRRAARQLGIDPLVLTRLRLAFHACGYRAVAMRRPEGDASLTRICASMADSLGLAGDAARVIREAEISVDIEHLKPNLPLLNLISGYRRKGKRVIAVSDMYYSSGDLRRILEAVTGRDRAFDQIYASSDLGLTKQSGLIFSEVERREGVPSGRILHVGDNHEADVRQALAAGWSAVHLPRPLSHRAAKIGGKAAAVLSGLRPAG